MVTADVPDGDGHLSSMQVSPLLPQGQENSLMPIGSLYHPSSLRRLLSSARIRKHLPASDHDQGQCTLTLVSRSVQTNWPAGTSKRTTTLRAASILLHAPLRSLSLRTQLPRYQDHSASIGSRKKGSRSKPSQEPLLSGSYGASLARSCILVWTLKCISETDMA